MGINGKTKYGYLGKKKKFNIDSLEHEKVIGFIDKLINYLESGSCDGNEFCDIIKYLEEIIAKLQNDPSVSRDSIQILKDKINKLRKKYNSNKEETHNNFEDSGFEM